MRTTSCLNGYWRLLLDPENVGKTESWDAARVMREGHDIRVPSTWEELHPGYDGVGWYAREFDLPQTLPASARLSFGAVNYKAEVWVNGGFVGTHEGGYTGFVLDVSKFIKPGTNTLLVRVIDVCGKEIEGLSFSNCPSSKESGQGNLGGIWQDVALIAAGDARLDVCEFLPKPLQQQLLVRLKISSDRPMSACVRLSAENAKGDDGTGFRTERNLELAQGTTSVEWTVDFKNFHFWSPETPVCYRAVTTLVADGTITDAQSDIFGMREFTVRGQQFLLNGQPIYLKGMLHQGPYALTVAYPEDEELARREILHHKEANCNIMRLHIKPAAPVIYRLADELGLMLYDETPIGWMPVDAPDLKPTAEREIREMIARSINHPSVVMWGVLNETGNAGFAKKGGCQEIRDDLTRYARSCDPSRIIVDDSGSFEFTGRSCMILPWETELTPTHDRHGYYRAPLMQKDYERMKTMGDGQHLLFRSEYGCGGMPDIPEVLARFERRRPGFASVKRGQYEAMLALVEKGWKLHGLDQVFSSISEFCLGTQNVQADGVLLETQAMRMNPNIPGYIICQYADFPRETGAGLVDLWREKKKAFETFRLVNRPLQATLMADPVCCWPGQSLSYELAVVNEGNPIPGATVHVRLIDAAGSIVCAHRIPLDIAREVRPLTPPVVAAPAPGVYRLEAEITGEGVPETVTRLPITCIARRDFATLDPVHVIDCNGQLTAFLQAQGARVIPFTGTEEASTILVGGLEDLDAACYERILAAYALVNRGALLAFLGIGTAKPMSPWYKSHTLDFSPKWFPETVKLICAEGRTDNAYHYVKTHPLFDDLPQSAVINLEFRNVYPRNCMVETPPEAEILAGCFHMLPTFWGVDAELLPRGAGKVLINQFHIIPNLGVDPAADLMLHNLLRWSKDTFRLTGSAETDEARTARLAQAASYKEFIEAEAREWMVCGPFPNPGDNEGMAKPTAAEGVIDPSATYEGCHGTVRWMPFTAVKPDDYLIDLGRLCPQEQSFSYAVAFIKSTVRKQGIIEVEGNNIQVLWNNQEIIRVNVGRHAAKHTGESEVRRGWNKILIKSAEFNFDGTGSNRLRVRILDMQGNPFPDLAFTVVEADVRTAEKEIAELFLPPYLR
jgi:hypothetical protein